MDEDKWADGRMGCRWIGSISCRPACLGGYPKHVVTMYRPRQVIGSGDAIDGKFSKVALISGVIYLDQLITLVSPASPD